MPGKVFGPDHGFLPTITSRTGSIVEISVTLPSLRPSRTCTILGSPSGPTTQTPGPFATVPAGFHRRAAFGASNALDRESVSILTLAVIPARSAGSLLFELKPYDPPTLLASIALLTGIAVLASLLPALRAAKVDPMVALRYE